MSYRRRRGKSAGGNGQPPRPYRHATANGHQHHNGHNGHALPRHALHVRQDPPPPAAAAGRQRPCGECGAWVFGRYPKGCPSGKPAGKSRLCVYGAYALYKGPPPAEVLKEMGLEPRPVAPEPSSSPTAGRPERTIPISVSFLPSLVRSVDRALEAGETRSAFLQAASRRELARRGEEGGEARGA